MKVCASPGCPVLTEASRCPDHRPAAWSKSSSSSRSLPRDWNDRRARVLERDGHACYVCGRPAVEVDHLLPRTAGGGDELSNLAAICEDHHREKSKAEAAAGRARAAAARRARGR